MSDQTTIVDVDTLNGRIVVLHVVGSTVEHGIMMTYSNYEVLVNGELKHKSNDPEDIMRALGHYIAGLSYE